MHTTLSTRRRWTLMAIALLISTAFAFATGTREEAEPTREATRRPIRELNHDHDERVTDLIGTPVVIEDGTQTATIEDVIVDIGQGHLLYLVISFTSDAYRKAGTLFPVPLYLFEPQDDQLVLYAENDTYLENMPSIDEIDAYNPDQDDEWGRWMFSFWNVYPGLAAGAYDNDELDDGRDRGDSAYREDRLWSYRYNYSSGPQVVPVALLRGSELIGYDVTTYEGETGGQITDLVVNVENGQLLLVSMAPSPAIEASASHYLVPLSALTANRETGAIMLDGEYQLPGAAGFDNNWPDLTNQGFHNRMTDAWDGRGGGIGYGAGMQVLPMRLVPDTIVENYDIFTRDSESLGSIEDLLIRQDGSIAYAIFEYDEVWEIDWEDQTSIVPLSLLTIQPISQAAVLGVRVRDLDSLPKFDDGLVVDTSAANWNQSIRAYWDNLYGVEIGEQSVGQIPTVESWDAVGNSEYLPASAIRNFDVVDANGEWIGEVEEIAIDMIRAEVGYLRLEVDESGLFADAEVAVPITAFRFNAQEEQLVLNATQERLTGAPGYDEIPAEAGRDFLEEVRAYWAN